MLSSSSVQSSCSQFSTLLLSTEFIFHSFSSMEYWLTCLVLLGLVSCNVVTLALSRSLEEFTEQKNYYPPSTGSSPTVPSNGGSHSSPTPYHGSPSTPSSGGSGYYHSPPSGGSYPSPVVNPPSSPTPTYPSPSTPQIPPFFTGTCKFWGSHPEVIAAIIGSLGSISDLFGHGCAGMFGSNPSLPDALTNTRADGYGALFREGTASFLNSMVNSKFPYSTPQVQSGFASAIASDGAAGAQAEIFRQANEGKFKA